MGQPLRIEAPAFALMAALGLAGCFGSRTSFIQPRDSLKLFGERGQATRVHIGAMNGPSEDIEFVWTGDAYTIADPAGRHDPAAYRLAPLRDAWLITQRVERNVSEYGLARRDGERLWTYSPECRDLTDAERQALGLALEANGTCWISTPAQLKGAMGMILPRNPKPDGYYELHGR
jgi:hypothetical protein